jgi:CAAX prenyl protease-like protein
MLLARLRTPFARAFAAPEILAPALAFAAIEIAAAAYVIARRGTEFVPLLVLAGLAVAFYAVLGWLAGRHPLAESAPDPVRSPRLEAFAIGIAYVGLAGWGFGVLPFGMHLFLGGLCGWIAAAVLGGYRRGDLRWATRSWRPYLPLFVGVTAPKLLTTGLMLPIGLLIALPSGLLQQLLLQLGLTARVEALVRRSAVAAVAAAVAFGFLHVPMNLGMAGGDWSIAFANALVLQTPIGLAFCVAYQRHRAPLALGAVHAILMA